jgi:hypothetical protein
MNDKPLMCYDIFTYVHRYPSSNHIACNLRLHASEMCDIIEAATGWLLTILHVGGDSGRNISSASFVIVSVSFRKYQKHKRK